MFLDKTNYSDLELELTQELVEISGFSDSEDLIRFFN